MAPLSTTQNTSVQSLDQPNDGGVRTVHSTATSAYKDIAGRVGKLNLNLLLDLGAKVSILHKSFVFRMKPRPQLSPSAKNLQTYSGTLVTTLGAISSTVSYGTHLLSAFKFYVVPFGQSHGC